MRRALPQHSLTRVCQPSLSNCVASWGDCGRKQRRGKGRIGGWTRTEKGDWQDILCLVSLLVQDLGLSENIEGKACATYDRFAVAAFMDLSSDVEPTLKGLKTGGITTAVLFDYPRLLKRHSRLLGIAIGSPAPQSQACWMDLTASRVLSVAG